MHRILPAIGCIALLSTACSQASPVFPSPQITTPTISPAPAAPFAFAQPFTLLTIGGQVHRKVGSGAENPDCVDFPGWGCHYFRITPSTDGVLEVVLTWLLESQPSQPLDLSSTDSRGGTAWSNYGPGSRGALSIPVKAGSTYQMTVWYTFPGVEFEIGASLQ